MLIDTHCHIHESSYPLDRLETLERARAGGVAKLICVGTNEQSSREAIDFAKQYQNVFASVGVHPHDTKEGWVELSAIVESNRWTTVMSKHLQPEHDRAPGPLLVSGAKPFASDSSPEDDQLRSKLIAIGEIGLDYFYTHSSREVQIEALQAQIELALKYDLPIIFHVRDAFDDFWPIFDNFSGIRGELHSFTDTSANLEAGLSRGLYVGVNGISTFTKSQAQQTLFSTIPLDRLLLETDAPYLTPVPLRGRVNEPAFVKNVAEHHARVRGLPLEEIAAATSANANALFAL